MTEQPAPQQFNISFLEMLQLLKTGTLTVETHHFTGQNLAPFCYFTSDFQVRMDGSKILVGFTTWLKQMRLEINDITLVAETWPGQFPDVDQIRRFSYIAWDKMITSDESLPTMILILTDEQAKIMKLTKTIRGNNLQPSSIITEMIADTRCREMSRMRETMPGAEFIENPSELVEILMLDREIFNATVSADDEVFTQDFRTSQASDV